MSRFTSSALSWLECILKERFGLEFILRIKDEGLLLSLSESEKSIYFDKLQEVFHKSHSDFACYKWKPSREGFISSIDDVIYAPSEFELPSQLIEVDEKGAVIHYDILGLAYWMLTRMEEVERKDLDKHQRFPAVASHAYLHNYLEYPIVDEWLAILGQVISRVWPQLQLKKHSFSMRVSHDVDNPSAYGFKSWPMIGRIMTGHLLKRRDLKAFFVTPYARFSTKNKIHPSDPCNTFSWLMDVSEANNLKSAFYFICGRTNPAYDAEYEIEHPAIRHLMSQINKRGHEIGLHPSYETYQSPELIKLEAERLKRVCKQDGIEQKEWGGRMHYLRWKQSITMRGWADAGMSYDSSLGYADRPGFRCGTCHEYPAFDPISQESLNLRIRPLVVMECTIIDRSYMGLGISFEAQEKMKLLKERCRLVNGNFTLLWHNSYFRNNGLKDIYKNVVSN